MRLTSLTVWIPTVVAVVASCGTYLGVRLQRSGRIRSSEATDLWRESSALRLELRQDTHQLRQELNQLRVENDQQRTEMATLRAARDDCLQARADCLERLRGLSGGA